MTDLLRIVDWKTSQSHRTDQGSSKREDTQAMKTRFLDKSQSNRADQGSSKRILSDSTRALTKSRNPTVQIRVVPRLRSILTQILE